MSIAPRICLSTPARTLYPTGTLTHQ